jgi:hypothetical protein
MKTFAGIFIANGDIRRLTFQAPDEREAKTLALKWGIGLEGEVSPVASPPPVEVPFAFDIPTSMHLLGNVSRSSIYRWVATNELKRVPDTRKVLITRASMERFTASRN